MRKRHEPEVEVTFHGNKLAHAVYPHPAPAREMMPKWYRDTKAFPTWEAGTKVGTVRACSPFLDALSLGYIIPLPITVTAHADKDGVVFDWSGAYRAISQHAREQMPNGPYSDPFRTFKFDNPWVVRTPPGYSCLFVHPLNHDTNLFHTYSGVVETDTYETVVHFPFHWTATDYNGILEAGTPIVQVIPFKRESHMGEVVREATEDELFNRVAEGERASTQWRYYARERRVPKIFRMRRD
jgi:hypothetical protein